MCILVLRRVMGVCGVCVGGGGACVGCVLGCVWGVCGVCVGRVLGLCCAKKLIFFKKSNYIFSF